MKKILVAFSMILFALPVYAAMPFPNKSGDENLQALIEETLPKFHTMTFKEKDLELPCNIFLPEDYLNNNKKYPLVIFIADASVVGKSTDAPLRQGYGGIIWASEQEQEKNQCIVAVPEFPGMILDDHGGYTMNDYVEFTEKFVRALIASFKVDSNRVYVTGQSMGCMTFLYLASKYPDLFAAEIFVSGQWDVNELTGLKSQKFFYITAAGDEKASTGQSEVIEMFEKEKILFNNATEIDAKMSQEDFTKLINEKFLANETPANFIRFKLGSVLDENIPVGSPEHMFSFDYAYKIDAVREWLFRQKK